MNEYFSAPEQLSYARSSILSDGPGSGMRIIDVCNGKGLNCTVVPDRGLNVVECFYRGIPMVYRMPGGHHPTAGNFVADWEAGLFTTCGLHNVGTPSMGEPLHGRMPHIAANEVGVSREENALVITGRLNERQIFGTDLELCRKLVFHTDCNRIEILDTVTNRAWNPDDAAILYHCNFGYPLVTENTFLEAPEHQVEPRNADAEKGLNNWKNFERPQDNFKEQCFLHHIKSTSGSFAAMKLCSPDTGFFVQVSYDTATLPIIVEWKNCLRNFCVLGLEPGNASLAGREADLKDKRLAHLEPGESVKFHVVFDFGELK